MRISTNRFQNVATRNPLARFGAITIMSVPTKIEPAVALEVAESPDRSWAAAVHISSIFWPLIGPLVGWALFAKSKPYVAAHAKQALLETIVLNVCLFLVGLASFTYTVFRIVHFVQTNWKDFSWQEFVVRFIVGFIVLSILQIVNIVISLNQARKAFKGDWPKRYRA